MEEYTDDVTLDVFWDFFCSLFGYFLEFILF